MIIALLSIIFIAPIFSLLLYKHQGKRQLINLDLVQFVYLFVVSPILFIWVKSFLFYIMRGEVGGSLSVNELFIIDTVLSVIAFYTFSAIAIHTLTKTFRLHKDHNPMFDLFELSEYFHLWWSHLIIWIGIMSLLLFVSIVNLFVPMAISPQSFSNHWSVLAGLFLGAILYLGVIVRTYLDSESLQANYLRVMKLCFALFFVIHVVLYFLVNPTFDVTYSAYWTVLNTFFATVFCSLVFRFSQFRKIVRRMLEMLRLHGLLVRHST